MTVVPIKPELMDPLARTLAIIAANTAFGPRYRIGASATLEEDLELGLPGIVSIAIDLEEAFDIDVPDEDVGKWRTVADVVATVARCARLDPKTLLPIEGEAS
jgi:acyl carrier protein